MCFYKTCVSVTAIGMVLAMSEPVFAQDANDTDGNDSNTIIVTGLKVAQSLDDSAIAIVAVGGDALQQSGINSAIELGSAVTGVAVAKQGSTSNLSIRGVGSSQFSPLGGSAVGFIQDGVALEGNIGLTSGFFDLERVEVMKGPQGTLYGLNATGGVISVVSARPRIGEASGAVDVEFGNYDHIGVSGHVNVPLGDYIAARFSGTYRRHDGYLADTYNDADEGGFRGQILFDQDTWSLLLAGDYYHEGGVGNSQVPLPFSSGRGTVDGDPFNVDYYASADGDAFRDDEYWGLRAELNADLGFADLTIIPAYREVNTDGIQYINSFRADVTNRSSQTSVEARLTGNVGAVDWLLGGYAFWGDRTYEGFFYSTGWSPNPFAPPPPLLDSFVGGDAISANSIYSETPKESQAVFGQLTWSVTDELRLVGGLRYSHDRREVAPNIDSVLKTTLPFVPPPLASFVPQTQLGGVAVGPGPSFSLDSLLALDPTNLFIDASPAITRSEDFNNVDFKIGVEYDVGADTLLYANLTTGYKAGGINTYAFGNGSLTYEPEELTSYEAGVRSRIGDLRIHLNGFYWSYENHQEGAIYNIPGVGTKLLMENIPDGHLYGADLELGWEISRDDNLGVSVSWLESDTGPFTIGDNFVEPNGHEYVSAPRWTINGSYEHVFALGEFEIVARGEGHYQSASNLVIRFAPETEQEAYFTGNLFLTLRPESQGWYIGAFARNVTNKDYLTGAIKAPGLAPDYWGNLGSPRTYGVRAGFNF